MDVIGAGWGRTGTTSAAAALDRLGFGPVMQMQETWSHPELAEVWNHHHDGRPADWETVLADYRATVDWPGCWEWSEFADMWPAARVLLTVRDSATWYDSVRRSIHAWTAPGEDVGPPPVAELLTRIWDEDFGGWDAVFDRDRTIAIYEAHNDEVRRTCPPDRLIEWNVADGWRRLCEGLDVPMPDEPFPHLNQRPT